jgi:ferredoxin-nitrite reductase
MIELLKQKFESRNKKLNKIEKLKELKSPKEAIENLKNLKISEEDRSFFLKCFGCFYKEKTDDYMIRVRIREGKLTPFQAKVIANIAQKYGDDYIDLTTRMQLELRYIKEKDLYKVLSTLENADITTYQTGVDNFRGIVIDPLAGYSKSSIINERDLTRKIENIFLKVDSEIASLPRKFNIGLCGNIKNSSNVFGQDLGFALAKRDGEYGFKVFMGGKVGAIAKDSNIFVNKKEALILFKGIKELFKTYGFRDNRIKNRFHFLLKEVGIDNFVKAIEEFCKYEFKKGGEILTSTKIENSLKEELINGKYAYKFIVPAGIFSGSDLMEASILAQDDDAFIALTYDQSFYIVNSQKDITSTSLYKKYSPSTYRNNLIACAGTKTCSFAVIRNKEDAIELAKELEILVPLDGEVKFHWSGCIKGCGIHGLGDFGFVGAKLKVGNEMKEAIEIYLGGNSQKEGKKILKVELSTLSKHIEPMLKFYKEYKKDRESFEKFLKNSSYSIWAYAFIMKINGLGFEFIPNQNSHANKIEFFEIKEIANQISYKLTKQHSLDNIFEPLQIKTLKEQGFKESIHKIFDNMLKGKYKSWTEVLVEFD